MINIQIDTREKAHAIEKILREFDARGIQHFSSKLFVGDYMNMDNPKVIVDRKQNLSELCGNVGQQHERFRAEIERATACGIHLIFLCEHGKGIKSIEDVPKWWNPRLKYSPVAITGKKLYRILKTLEEKYGVEFLFCSKDETAQRIIELLEARNEETHNAGKSPD